MKCITQLESFKTRFFIYRKNMHWCSRYDSLRMILRPFPTPKYNGTKDRDSYISPFKPNGRLFKQLWLSPHLSTLTKMAMYFILCLYIVTKAKLNKMHQYIRKFWYSKWYYLDIIHLHTPTPKPDPMVFWLVEKFTILSDCLKVSEKFAQKIMLILHTDQMSKLQK